MCGRTTENHYEISRSIRFRFHRCDRRPSIIAPSGFDCRPPRPANLKIYEAHLGRAWQSCVSKPECSLGLGNTGNAQLAHLVRCCSHRQSCLTLSCWKLCRCEALQAQRNEYTRSLAEHGRTYEAKEEGKGLAHERHPFWCYSSTTSRCIRQFCPQF